MKLIDCPRDAMQGLHDFVPTETKIGYLNRLLRVGFDTLDFGSFVSPQAIPQMADTEAVLAQLEPSDTRLLAIVANLRGAVMACSLPAISYLGFPLSVSEEFQQRNTRKRIAQALEEVAEMQERCITAGKELVVYLSMAFGNPYGEAYSPQTVVDLTGKLADLGVRIVAPSDTIGSSSPEGIRQLFGTLIPAFPEIEFGAHLHSTPDKVLEKMEATWEAGVRRVDGALRGFGGCPMAADQLTGNMPTESWIAFLEQKGAGLKINQDALEEAMGYSGRVFGRL
ncbi:MAG: hydroxymethylglutaryl-CoA lyase [Siphonobacter aquaeclarae]|nr:hydroxymethylglutaryl-CoA lyase [Siphonobacter aquaeclarae]